MGDDNITDDPQDTLTLGMDHANFAAAQAARGATDGTPRHGGQPAGFANAHVSPSQPIPLPFGHSHQLQRTPVNRNPATPPTMVPETGPADNRMIIRPSPDFEDQIQQSIAAHAHGGARSRHSSSASHTRGWSGPMLQAVDVAPATRAGSPRRAGLGRAMGSRGQGVTTAQRMEIRKALGLHTADTPEVEEEDENEEIEAENNELRVDIEGAAGGIFDDQEADRAEAILEEMHQQDPVRPPRNPRQAEEDARQPLEALEVARAEIARLRRAAVDRDRELQEADMQRAQDQRDQENRMMAGIQQMQTRMMEVMMERFRELQNAGPQVAVNPAPANQRVEGQAGDRPGPVELGLGQQAPGNPAQQPGDHRPGGGPPPPGPGNPGGGGGGADGHMGGFPPVNPAQYAHGYGAAGYQRHQELLPKPKLDKLVANTPEAYLEFRRAYMTIMRSRAEWTQRQRKQFLMEHIQKEAAVIAVAVAYDLEDDDVPWQTVLQRVEDVFLTRNNSSQAAVEFRAARQRKNETIMVWAARLRDLHARAFSRTHPTLDLRERHDELRQAFATGLNDHNVQLAINTQINRSETLLELAQIAVDAHFHLQLQSKIRQKAASLNAMEEGTVAAMEDKSEESATPAKRFCKLCTRTSHNWQDCRFVKNLVAGDCAKYGVQVPPSFARDQERPRDRGGRFRRGGRGAPRERRQRRDQRDKERERDDHRGRRTGRSPRKGADKSDGRSKRDQKEAKRPKGQLNAIEDDELRDGFLGLIRDKNSS